jgi:hypothetical protein
MTLDEWLAMGPIEITPEITTVIRYLVSRQVSEHTIIAATCAQHGLSVTLVKSSCKDPRITRVRHECFVALENAGFGVGEIGRLFGYDRSGVRHAIDRRLNRVLREVAAE